MVGQQTTYHFIVLVILWFTVKWRPRLLFSFQRVKILFSYGWKLLVSSLMDTIYMDLRSIIIGKMYNAEMLGLYNRGKQFPLLIAINIDGSIHSVLFPALSLLQDNRLRVKDIVRRSIVTSTFILFPMMVGLAVIAEPLVTVLLTDKWLPSVPFLQIYCVIFALWPIHTANLQAINALGRSDIFLKLELIKKMLGLLILGLTIPYGIYAIAFGGIIVGVTSTVINIYPNIKLLNYNYKEQLEDIKPSFFLSIVMGVVVYSVHFLGLSAWPTLIIQVFVGVAIYVLLAQIFQLECFNYLVKTLKENMGKRSVG